MPRMQMPPLHIFLRRKLHGIQSIQQAVLLVQSDFCHQRLPCIFSPCHSKGTADYVARPLRYRWSCSSETCGRPFVISLAFSLLQSRLLLTRTDCLEPLRCQTLTNTKILHYRVQRYPKKHAFPKIFIKFDMNCW